MLLVEVKGVNGKPADDDSMQVQKNVIHRVREWKRLDIQGLTIINHERHLPPLDRENKSPFRDVILTNASHGRFGLLTTWDLVRLIRSFLKFGWSSNDVKAVFYRIGRIEPIPEHYEYVGHIQDFLEKAGVVTILVEGATLRSGDRIGFELPLEFEEQDNTSMQMEHKPVGEAEAGMLIALQTTLTKTQAKKGTRVYRVKRPPGL